MAQSANEALNMQTSSRSRVNLTTKELIDTALARGEGELASNQALVVKTGARTGRSPKDRFIVRDHVTEKTVDWNTINQPISPEKFSLLWEKASDYMAARDAHFVSYLKVGAHETLGIPVKVITELAWHTLFANVLFIRPETPAVTNEPNQWTILSAPGFKPNGAEDGVNGDAAVILNFADRRILITGTYYAG